MQATLIGDVVGSRQSSNRALLQQQLLALLASVGGRFGTTPEVTLGDEFQARYTSVADAVAASWFLHLGSIDWCRLRVGIGWGEVTVEGDGRTSSQDGPAWWRARDAVTQLGSASQPARTLVSTDTNSDDLINAYLFFRDIALDGLDESDSAIVLGLADGQTQRRLAEKLGIHESSVSRRVSRRHLASLTHHAAPTFDVVG